MLSLRKRSRWSRYSSKWSAQRTVDSDEDRGARISTHGRPRLKVLVLGGTGFLGPYVLRYLSDMGHDLTVVHTGQHEVALPSRVRHIHHPSAGIPLSDIPDEARRSAPDVVLHMVPVGERDAALVMAAFRGIAGRVVSISSQDVYLAHGRLLRTEPGPPEQMPLTEDSPLREKLYPYRGEIPRSE